MLSGKTQYYNAVRKESFKTINSVTFCAGTKGRLLVMCQTGLGWAGLGWAGLGWAGLG
jgi:hypothetical protein